MMAEAKDYGSVERKNPHMQRGKDGFTCGALVTSGYSSVALFRHLAVYKCIVLCTWFFF